MSISEEKKENQTEQEEIKPDANGNYTIHITHPIKDLKPGDILDGIDKIVLRPMRPSDLALIPPGAFSNETTLRLAARLEVGGAWSVDLFDRLDWRDFMKVYTVAEKLISDVFPFWASRPKVL